MKTKKRQDISESYNDWPLEDRPGFLARRMHQIHVSLFAEKCSSFGVTPLQYSLMSALAVRDWADQTTLANDVALDRTTTTGALKRLIARGYVQRRTSEADRRSQACRLTAEGRFLLHAMEQFVRDAHEATIDMLTPKERRQLIDLMKRVVAAQIVHTENEN